MPREAARAHGRPLHVLMVLESDFTQKGGGGAESQLRTIARHLKSLGQGVTIVTPMLPRGRQLTAERCYGLPVGRIAYPRVPLVGAGILAARFAAFLWQHRERYDAWHVHIGHNLGAITCLVGSLLGKPVVVKISGWWELEEGLLGEKRGVLGAIGRSFLKRATYVQAISTRIAKELERAGFPTERILVLPNAVDTRRFRAHKLERKKGAPFVAVFVGRLVPEKGLTTLLDAWAQAFAGRPRDSVRLQLVGGGPLEGELRAQAERLGIAAQVELLGHRDRVEEVLAGAHVGVLPSRIEGLSNTMLELMASGVPVIASRVSGSEDFVRPGESGWLFDVGDTAALAAALRDAAALGTRELAALGQRARTTVEDTAAIDLVVGRLMSLYRHAPAGVPSEPAAKLAAQGEG